MRIAKTTEKKYTSYLRRRKEQHVRVFLVTHFTFVGNRHAESCKTSNPRLNQLDDDFVQIKQLHSCVRSALQRKTLQQKKITNQFEGRERGVATQRHDTVSCGASVPSETIGTNHHVDTWCGRFCVPVRLSASSGVKQVPGTHNAVSAKQASVSNTLTFENTQEPNKNRNHDPCTEIQNRSFLHQGQFLVTDRTKFEFPTQSCLSHHFGTTLISLGWTQFAEWSLNLLHAGGDRRSRSAQD